jgi:UDP-perosamine 4-acetyltransferase
MKAVVLGSGGHAKVVIEILKERDDLDLVGCVTREAGSGAVCGVKVIGDDSILPRLREMGVQHVFVALGNNGLRFRMINHVVSMGFNLLNAISRHAVLSPSVSIGAGVAIMAGAVVNAESSLGDGVIVNTGATVDHDCVLEAACHVAPGTNLAG